MKKLWWVVRIAVIVAASYCFLAPGGSYSLSKVQAEEGGCDNSVTCARNSDNNCYCPSVTIGGPGCTGCFVKNGSSGCGTCSSGPSLIE